MHHLQKERISQKRTQKNSDLQSDQKDILDWFLILLPEFKNMIDYLYLFYSSCHQKMTKKIHVCF